MDLLHGTSSVVAWREPTQLKGFPSQEPDFPSSSLKEHVFAGFGLIWIIGEIEDAKHVPEEQGINTQTWISNDILIIPLQTCLHELYFTFIILK